MRGKKLVRGLFLGALAVTALAASGCAGEAMRFNQGIVEYNKRLSAAGLKLGQAIKPALQGGNANVAEVKAAYNEAVNTLEQVKQEFANLKVPPGASSKKLADAYGKFLRGQDDIIRNKLGQIVKMVEGGRPNQAQMASIIMAIPAQENADLQEVQAAQREFAKDHNIRLIQNP
jgi:hypothetical protein